MNTKDIRLKEFEKKTLFLEIRKGDGTQILPVYENDRSDLIEYFKESMDLVEKEAYDRGYDQCAKNEGN